MQPIPVCCTYLEEQKGLKESMGLGHPDRGANAQNNCNLFVLISTAEQISLAAPIDH